MSARYGSACLAPRKRHGRDQSLDLDYEREPDDQDEIEQDVLDDDDDDAELDEDFQDDQDEVEEEAETEEDGSAEFAEADVEDEEEHDDDDADEVESDGYGSLQELAAAIDEAHEKSRRCHELSNQYALRAGQHLLVVKQRLGHGKFGKWLTDNVNVSQRQAERYLKLFEGREELNELNADWLTEWSMSLALAKLGDQRPEHDDEDESGAAAVDEEDEDEPEDEAEEVRAEEATGRKAQSGEEDDDRPEEEQASPRLTDKQLRQARAAHRQRVKQLPTFLKTGPVKFGRNSAGLEALQEVGAALVKAARQAARRLHSKELAERGVDEDLVAMALAELLPRKLTVAKLFEPVS
jgi:hypothetical protein